MYTHRFIFPGYVFMKYFKDHLQFLSSYDSETEIWSRKFVLNITLLPKKTCKKTSFQSCSLHPFFFSVQRYQLAKSRFLFSPPLLPFFWPDWALPTLKFSNWVGYVGYLFIVIKMILFALLDGIWRHQKDISKLTDL